MPNSIYKGPNLVIQAFLLTTQPLRDGPEDLTTLFSQLVFGFIRLIMTNKLPNHLQFAMVTKGSTLVFPKNKTFLLLLIPFKLT